MIGLYLHVPFCLQKCGYCSFFSVAGGEDLFADFTSAAIKQLEDLSRSDADHQVTTIFFGGGTPSVLLPEQLVHILSTCLQCFPVPEKEDCEISIEVNPATIDYHGLLTLRRAGFNRISIGIQSFDDKELQQLGRAHTRDQALETIQSARWAGFDNVSFDLMYSLPGQDPTTWQHTLDFALSLSPDHLSMYEMTLEEGTPLYTLAEQGAITIPQEEAVLEMMEAIEATIAPSQLSRYEISNYARPGKECRHNQIYWNNGNYIGVGPGSVSSLGGVRYTTRMGVGQYCQKIRDGERVWTAEEHLEADARLRETVIIGLRLLAGVDLAALKQRFKVDVVRYYGPVLVRLLEQGLLEIEQGHLRLTRQGLPIANTVMAELV